MLRFVYFAKKVMDLPMESMATFCETLVEPLGDLARNKMVMEETDVEDGELV